MRLASYYASACMLWLSRACKCDVDVSCTSASSYMTMDGRAKKRAASERDFSIIHFSWNRSRFKPFFRLTLNIFPRSSTLADKLAVLYWEVIIPPTPHPTSAVQLGCAIASPTIESYEIATIASYMAQGWLSVVEQSAKPVAAQQSSCLFSESHV